MLSLGRNAFALQAPEAAKANGAMLLPVSVTVGRDAGGMVARPPLWAAIILIASTEVACDKERPALSAPASGSDLAASPRAAAPVVGPTPDGPVSARADVNGQGSVAIRSDPAAPVRVFAPKEQPDTVQIDNQTDAPVSFRMAVDVLVLDARRGAYDEVPGAGMVLAEVCRSTSPACTTIPAHGSLRSLPYRPGCSSPCAKCGPQTIRPGTYVLRVTACDTSKPLHDDFAGASVTTEPFVVDRDGSVKSVR